MWKFFAAAILTVFVASRAHAAPITVSAGDFLTFNFDLSSETPPPPYVIAGMSTNTTGLDFEPCDVGLCELLDIGVWTFWTELNGTGESFATAEANLGGQHHTEMLDGVFSATLQMFEGSITVDPVACGITADGARTPGCPPAPEPPPPAPEPATVGLVAIGAATLLARRRRTRAV